MELAQARRVLSSIPDPQWDVLNAAYDRYLSFAGIPIEDGLEMDHVAEDRAAFPHLLVFAAGGRPLLSAERCTAFMAVVTGLPQEWCVAFEEIAFVDNLGENFFEEQEPDPENDRLAYGQGA